jgi:hypothetical protein
MEDVVARVDVPRASVAQADGRADRERGLFQLRPEKMDRVSEAQSDEMRRSWYKRRQNQPRARTAGFTLISWYTKIRIAEEGVVVFVLCC